MQWLTKNISWIAFLSPMHRFSLAVRSRSIALHICDEQIPCTSTSLPGICPLSPWLRHGRHTTLCKTKLYSAVKIEYVFPPTGSASSSSSGTFPASTSFPWPGSRGRSPVAIGQGDGGRSRPEQRGQAVWRRLQTAQVALGKVQLKSGMYECKIP